MDLRMDSIDMARKAVKAHFFTVLVMEDKLYSPSPKVSCYGWMGNGKVLHHGGCGLGRSRFVLKELIELERTDAAAGRDRKVAQGANPRKLIKFE